MGAADVTSISDIDGLVVVFGQFLRHEVDEFGPKLVLRHHRTGREPRDVNYMFSKVDFETQEPTVIVDQLQLVQGGDPVVIVVRPYVTKSKSGTYYRAQSIRRVTIAGAVPAPVQ